MKRSACFLLTLALMLSLNACEKKEDQTGDAMEKDLASASDVLVDPTTQQTTVETAADDTSTANSSSDAIADYVRAEAERVANVVQSRQNANTITFFACSDIHYYAPGNALENENAEKMQEAVVSMGQAMELIRDRVPIDFAAMLGDVTWDSGETKAEQLDEMRFVNECLEKGFHGIPQFRIEGNHDDAYGSGNALTAAEIFDHIGVWNEGAVYGNREAGYCYRDFENVKLRVICLNTSQYSGSAFLTDAEQVAWLGKVLDLRDKGDDWSSILLSHHPLDWGKEGGVNPVATINSATGLIASFHGHIHNFLTGTVTGTKLPRIAIPNAGYSRENQYGEAYGITWKEDTTYSKTPGTAQNTSFCVVTIDLAEKMLYADHYGAGVSRVISLDENPDENSQSSANTEGSNGGTASAGMGQTDMVYDNRVPDSIDKDGSVYNGTGYQEKYRLNSSGLTTEAAGAVHSGFIAYDGEVIRVYGSTHSNSGNNENYVILYNSNFDKHYVLNAGNWISVGAVWSELDGKYMLTIDPAAITNAVTRAALAEAEYIRCSMASCSGADFVVTLDAPISE